MRFAATSRSPAVSARAPRRSSPGWSPPTTSSSSGSTRDTIYRHAVELEGHPDNVAAALYGGFVLCPTAEGDELPAPVRLDPPHGVEAVLVIPAETVPTAEARMAIPPAISVTDAVANVAAASQLVLGLERSDLALIASGLADRLHQPARRELYPRSMELVARARELGAIGATISGAGPSVMLWCYWQDTGKVVEARRRGRGRLGRGRARAVQPARRGRPGALGPPAT